MEKADHSFSPSRCPAGVSWALDVWGLGGGISPSQGEGGGVVGDGRSGIELEAQMRFFLCIRLPDGKVQVQVRVQDQERTGERPDRSGNEEECHSATVCK